MSINFALFVIFCNALSYFDTREQAQNWTFHWRTAILLNTIYRKDTRMKSTTNHRTKKMSYETAFYIAGWCMVGLFIPVVLYLCSRDPHTDTLLPPCILHLLTGAYCPGCGGTRAVWYLFHGDLLRTLLYHPLVFYIAVFGGWFMTSQTVERISRHKIRIGLKYHDNYLWAALVIVVVNFIVKNFFLFVLHIDLLAF